MAEDAAAAGSESGGQRGFWGLVAKATALLTLIGLVVGLAAKFWPEPEPVRKAEMSTRVDSGLTRREYFERIGLDPGGLSDKVLNQKGALIQFTVEATGYEGKDLNLKWAVLDGVHPTPVKSDAITVTPGADTDRLSPDPVFAPFPKGRGPFKVEGDLRAPDGVSIAQTEKDFERG
jgi:hypothetical protein